MAIEEQHIALPRLYGAPAYSRPARPVEVTPRPFDPDDLPIAAYQTDEEREIAQLGVDGVVTNDAANGNGHDRAHPAARPLSLRAFAGRLLKG